MPLNCSELDLLALQLHHAHRSAVSAELAARGLNEIGHPMLLTILKTSGECPAQACGCTQRDLAQQLHISPPAVANSLKSLEKGGYIRREPGKDARCNQVLLTEKGIQAVDGCQAAFEAVSQRMMDGFTPEECAQLLAFRQRMLNNLREPSPAPKEEI